MATQETNLIKLSVADANAIGKLAADMAAKEKQSAETVTRLVKASEDWKGGALALYFSMEKDFTADELDMFPIPDSEVPMGNLGPDKFKVPVTKDNKTVYRPTTFYTLFSDATPVGKHCLEKIDFLSRHLSDKADKTGIPSDIIKLTAQAAKVELKYWEGKRSTIRQCYKKAMALRHKLFAINSLDKVELEPIMAPGKSDEAVNSPTPFMLVSTEKNNVGVPLFWKEMSLSTVMKLKPDVAKENGGDYEALLKTLEREVEDDKRKAGLSIETVETFENVIVTLSDTLDSWETDKRKEKLSELARILNKKGEDNHDVTVAALVDIRNAINTILSGVHNYEERHAKVWQGSKEEQAAA